MGFLSQKFRLLNLYTVQIEQNFCLHVIFEFKISLKSYLSFYDLRKIRRTFVFYIILLYLAILILRFMFCLYFL